jgi:MtN3 and saliva related transmembrane protein
MVLEAIAVLATITGLLMSFGHFPQAYKIYKNKSSKNISFISYSIFTFGAYIWFIYGLLLSDIPLIISYSLAVIGTTLVFVLMIKYRKTAKNI